MRHGVSIYEEVKCDTLLICLDSRLMTRLVVGVATTLTGNITPELLYSFGVIRS